MPNKLAATACLDGRLSLNQGKLRRWTGAAQPGRRQASQDQTGGLGGLPQLRTGLNRAGLGDPRTTQRAFPTPE